MASQPRNSDKEVTGAGQEKPASGGPRSRAKAADATAPKAPDDAAAQQDTAAQKKSAGTPRKRARKPSAQAAPKADAPRETQAEDQGAEKTPDPIRDIQDSQQEAARMLSRMADMGHGPTAQKLAENIERIEGLGQRLMQAFGSRSLPNPGVEGPGPDLFMTATSAFMKTLSEHPTRMLETQVSYWAETLANYSRAQQALAKGQLSAPEDENADDRRFSNPLWKSHPYFNLIKKQYQTNARALRDAASELQLPDQIARRRVDWLTNQIIDMMAPTNFLATNPDALEKAIETEGESLVRGLENLVRDVEMNGGEMVVSLADRNAFAVGDNIGTAPGTVVHRAPLYELIQYAPTTDKVHALPLIIFPPWINKFYILDLKPQNSMIRWLLEQGHTLFIVSWKNPGPELSETGMEDYIEAYLEAMDRVRDLTGQEKLNAVGYCIAGTTLSLTLALLEQRGDKRINSATLFTTLTDFSDQGEFTSFLQNDFVSGIAEEVKRHGLLRAHLMSRTMSFLRANDLVWGPAIRSYMMGEAPPAFDLLFWNGDSTNLPGRMAMQYLHGLCQQNAFAGEGFEVMGRRLHISDVKVPLCAIACETDHIAPWKDCWRGVAAMGTRDRTFILSQSGHIAGIVNPPSKKKYGHYVSDDDFASGHEAWRESASFHEGSWWPRWGEWLAGRAGRMVDARMPEDGLEPAPGSYVHERAG